MRISETVVGKTPDYEAFDTLYLSLTVTDLNQEINSDSDTGNMNCLRDFCFIRKTMQILFQLL